MRSGMVKSSTILIALGRKTAVYRSIEDLPPGLRHKLARTTNGDNAATILIADRNGRDELLKLMLGQPSNLRRAGRRGTQRPESGRWRRAIRRWPIAMALVLVVALSAALWLLAGGR
ncbi:MAG: hypothetical protein HYZ57_00295 [Acidobacteria bacterium]|nr:hypothetical protein [Acidobacteriota bacterium]MBI3278261.1 hypothetical protein [Acidobacteriota bacterium]